MNWFNAAQSLAEGNKIIDENGTFIQQINDCFVYIHTDGSIVTLDSIQLRCKVDYIPVVTVPRLTKEEKESVRWLVDGKYKNLWRTPRGVVYVQADDNISKPIKVKYMSRASCLSSASWIDHNIINMPDFYARQLDADYYNQRIYEALGKKGVHILSPEELDKIYNVPKEDSIRSNCDGVYLRVSL